MAIVSIDFTERYTMSASPRIVWTALAAILGAAVIGAVALAWSSLSAMMRPPASETVAQLTSAKTGAVDVVLEITTVDARRRALGTLLSPAPSDANYVRTKTRVQVVSETSTQFVMGTRRDLARGAVIDVRGFRTSISPLAIRANRIVVLTGNVTVR